MASPGTNSETLLARHTVVSLAVQALIERLLLSGVLAPPDLVQLRDFGLQLTDQLKQHGSSGAASGRRPLGRVNPRLVGPGGRAGQPGTSR